MRRFFVRITALGRRTAGRRKPGQLTGRKELSLLPIAWGIVMEVVLAFLKATA